MHFKVNTSGLEILTFPFRDAGSLHPTPWFLQLGRRGLSTQSWPPEATTAFSLQWRWLSGSSDTPLAALRLQMLHWLPKGLVYSSKNVSLNFSLVRRSCRFAGKNYPKHSETEHMSGTCSGYEVSWNRSTPKWMVYDGNCYQNWWFGVPPS